MTLVLKSIFLDNKITFGDKACVSGNHDELFIGKDCDI